MKDMSDQELIDALCDVECDCDGEERCESCFTDFEVKFVEDQARRLKEGFTLTVGMRLKAEQIGRERAGL